MNQRQLNVYRLLRIAAKLEQIGDLATARKTAIKALIVN